MTCSNIKTGKRKWITSKRFGEYMSMVAQDNLIAALNDRGVPLLIKASPKEFELLDSRKISDDSNLGTPSGYHQSNLGSRVAHANRFQVGTSG